MENCSYYAIFCFYTFFKGIKEEDMKPVSLKKKNRKNAQFKTKQNKTKQKTEKKLRKKVWLCYFIFLHSFGKNLKKWIP